MVNLRVPHAPDRISSRVTDISKKTTTCWGRIDDAAWKMACATASVLASAAKALVLTVAPPVESIKFIVNVPAGVAVPDAPRVTYALTPVVPFHKMC